ncbi:MAG: FtsH protease activity modulator HflK, partial [Rickettsiella sp.]|nr:FtsH protease activity modulator HflK [Rickettsiella sp.]
STLTSGRHWIFRPIETSYIISERNKPYSYKTDLLTSDKNKVSVVATVHYTIANARQYLFANTQPLQSLQEAIANATTQTLGQFSLEQLLTTNLFALQQTLQVQIDKLLANYTTGLVVNDIELQPIQVPEELKASFQDVSNAEIEKKQLENQAKIYAMQTQPKAKGESERLIADAKNYQQEVILNAKAETTRFLDLLPTYKAAPLLTRKRLYLEAMQEIMANSNKMLIDNQANTSLYLNIDKSAMQSHSEKATHETDKKPSSTAANTPSPSIKTLSKNKNDQELPSSYDIIGGYE